MTHFVENSKWFCKESRTFVDKEQITISGDSVYKYRTRDIFYFPIAYIKFMWSMRDTIIK